LERDTPTTCTEDISIFDIIAEFIIGLQFILGTVNVGSDTGPIWTLNRVLNGTSGRRTPSANGHTFTSDTLDRLFHWTSTSSRTVVRIRSTGIIRTHHFTRATLGGWQRVTFRHLGYTLFTLFTSNR